MIGQPFVALLFVHRATGSRDRPTRARKSGTARSWRACRTDGEDERDATAVRVCRDDGSGALGLDALVNLERLGSLYDVVAEVVEVAGGHDPLGFSGKTFVDRTCL